MIPYTQEKLIEHFNQHGLTTREKVFFYLKQNEQQIKNHRRKIATLKKLTGKKRANYIRRYAPTTKIYRFYDYLKKNQLIGTINVSKLLEL